MQLLSVLRHASTRVLCLFFACLMAMAAQAEVSEIKVRSVSDTYRGIKEATLTVSVVFPDGRDQADLVLVVNSSAGKSDAVMAALGDALLRAGIASALIDTYTPRGIGDTITDQSQLSYIEQFDDIFSVYHQLQRDPRFAGRKFALAGHSRGAILTYMAAFSGFKRYFEDEVPVFSAYIGLSTDCLPTFGRQGDLALLGPLHLVSGAQDNWTSPGPCVRIVGNLKAAGQPASIELIPGVTHGFSYDGVHISGAIKFACPLDGDYFYLRRERTGRPGLVFDPAWGKPESAYQQWRRCAGNFGFNGRGATGGGSRAMMPAAIDSALQFLKNQGW